MSSIFHLICCFVLSLFLMQSSFADGMPKTEEKPVRVNSIANSEKSKLSSPIQVGVSGNVKPLSAFELAKYQYCGDDKDCIIAINGCCDCANGGIEVAVNKDRLEAFRERFECLYEACGNKPADPPCANGVVSCVNHKCIYTDDVKR